MKCSAAAEFIQNWFWPCFNASLFISEVTLLCLFRPLSLTCFIDELYCTLAPHQHYHHHPDWLPIDVHLRSLFNWRAPLIAICSCWWWWWRNSKAKWRHQSGVVSAAAAAAHLERSGFLLVLLLPARANGMTSVHPILLVLCVFAWFIIIGYDDTTVAGFLFVCLSLGLSRVLNDLWPLAILIPATKAAAVWRTY